jgi:hypothetical protein
LAPPNHAIPHRTHEENRSLLRRHRELIPNYFRAQNCSPAALPSARSSTLRSRTR